MEVAADGPRVASLADVADDLPDVDDVSLLERGGMDHVRVPVLPPLAQPPEHDEVAVQAPVVGALDDGAGGDRGQRRAAVGGDVEALVAAAAVPRRVEVADRPSRPMRAADGEKVAVELDAPGVSPASADDRDHDLVAAVCHRAPAVSEPVPALDQVPAGL